MSKREERCGWVVGLDMENDAEYEDLDFEKGSIRFIQRKAPDFSGT